MVLVGVKELGLLLRITPTFDLQNFLIQFLEFLVFSLRAAVLLKKRFHAGVFLRILQIF